MQPTNLRKAEGRFNVLHPDHPVSRTYIRKLLRTFRATGPVQDAKRTGRSSIKEELEILAKFNETPQSSTRYVVEELKILQRHFQRIYGRLILI